MLLERLLDMGAAATIPSAVAAQLVKQAIWCRDPSLLELLLTSLPSVQCMPTEAAEKLIKLADNSNSLWSLTYLLQSLPCTTAALAALSTTSTGHLTKHAVQSGDHLLLSTSISISRWIPADVFLELVQQAVAKNDSWSISLLLQQLPGAAASVSAAAALQLVEQCLTNTRPQLLERLFAGLPALQRALADTPVPFLRMAIRQRQSEALKFFLQQRRDSSNSADRQKQQLTARWDGTVAPTAGGAGTSSVPGEPSMAAPSATGHHAPLPGAAAAAAEAAGIKPDGGDMDGGLSQPAVLQLLSSCCFEGSPLLLSVLLDQLPAAQQALAGSKILQWMAVAVAEGDTQALEAIAAVLPAAIAGTPIAHTFNLIQHCYHRGEQSLVRGLLKVVLSGVSSRGVVVSELAQLCLDRSDLGCLSMVLDECPVAAATVTKPNALLLLRSCFLAKAPAPLRVLMWQLPAARALAAEELAQLLVWASSTSPECTLTFLGLAPGIEYQMRSHTKEHLCSLLARLPCCSSCCRVCDVLKQAKQLQPATLAKIFMEVVQAPAVQDSTLTSSGDNALPAHCKHHLPHAGALHGLAAEVCSNDEHVVDVLLSALQPLDDACNQYSRLRELSALLRLPVSLVKVLKRFEGAARAMPGSYELLQGLLWKRGKPAGLLGLQELMEEAVSGHIKVVKA